MDSEGIDESGPMEQESSSTATDVQPGPTTSSINNEHSTTESTHKELTPEEVSSIA